VDVHPFDRAACLATGAASSILDDLKVTSESPHSASATASAHGWSVVVIVTPAAPGDGLDHLTRCDRDCLALLAQATAPLSGRRVRKEMEGRGVGVWGLVTVKRSLAKLRRLRLVSNSKRGQRGYFLPETSPVVRKAAG
jgi:hypothetical protein